jgi:hypothetical protein
VAFTVTARHSAGSGLTSSQTLASSSATETADSLLLVGMVAENDAHSTNQGWQTPTGGSLTYTQVAESADAAWGAADSTFSLSAAMYRAPISSSPSAHTITVDAFSGTQAAWYDVRACDITGHNAAAPAVQSKANSADINPASSSASGTVTLDAVPTAGNLIVVYFGCGADADGAPASPTAGGGKTFTAVSTSATAFPVAGLWYRVADGTESATITCSDLGTTVGNYGAIAVEIAAASGSASVPLQQWPTGNLVGGPWPRIQLGILPPDATGDAAIALGDSAAGTDALTASAAVPLSEAGSGADALTVAATAALSDTGTGSDALTVAAATPIADAGSGADALSATATVSLAESGTGTDALIVAAAVALSDTGTGTDSRSSTAAVPLADTGTGADSLSVAATATLSDSGAGSDTLTAAAAVPLAETGVGADTLNVSGSGAPSLPDAGAGTDSLTVAASVSLADTGAGVDAVSVGAVLALAEAAAAVDGFAAAAGLSLADTGSGADAMTVSDGTVVTAGYAVSGNTTAATGRAGVLT